MSEKTVHEKQITYPEIVQKRLDYIKLLAEQEHYAEIQNFLDTNFILGA